MTNILTIVGQITGAWTTATELAPLLLVPALVWGIRTALEIADRLAAAARATYRAGRTIGRLWFAYGRPALLRVADGISWVLAQIDWQEVAAIVRHGLIVVAAGTITAAVVAIPTLERLSARLGRRYAALLAPQAREEVLHSAADRRGNAELPLPTAAPHPLADLALATMPTLEGLPVATLRRLARAAGLPRSITRAGRRAALLPLLSGLEVALV